MKLLHIKVQDEITCDSELQFDGNAYFTCEYNRKKGKMTQIGVRVTQAVEVMVRQFEQNIVSLVYDERANIWYQKSEQWLEEGYKRATDGIFGINVGGSFEVVALNAAGEVIEQATVHITPGTMSLEEYKEMQQEVRHLFEVFAYDLTDDTRLENNLLRRIQMPLFPLAPFQEIIENTVLLMEELVAHPEVTLRPTLKKVHVKDVRKWTPALIIEETIRQQGKVTALINEPVTDIQENRMLRYMLEQYVERIQSELTGEQRQYRAFQHEKAELEVMIAQERGEMIVQPKKLVQVLEADCQLLEQRQKQWQALLAAVEDVLEQQLLQGESEQLEETFLFRMHPQYSELYALFLQYEELTPELTDTFRLFIQGLLKSPTLYEVWVLLKIIQQLSQWGANPKEFIEDLEQSCVIPNTHLISGYRKQFKLPNRPFDVWLYYDTVLDETGYRPDFVIGFQNIETGYWAFHTLDVKYKNYSAMRRGETSFETDIERSAYRYFVELLRPNYTVQSASLVHLDDKNQHWNAKPDYLFPKTAAHQLAHFKLSPHHSEGLAIYFKRLLHEGSDYGSCCPSCGMRQEGNVRNYQIKNGQHKWKTYYTCEACNEFWVANFCGDCAYNNRNTLEGRVGDFAHVLGNKEAHFSYPRPLYKYPTANYNLQVGDEWEVHCPSCNRLVYPERPYDFVDNVYSGPTVEYYPR